MKTKNLDQYLIYVRQLDTYYFGRMVSTYIYAWFALG